MDTPPLPPPNPGENFLAPAASPPPPLQAGSGAGASAPRGWWIRATRRYSAMVDDTEAKPGWVIGHCISSFLSHVESLGGA